MKKIVLNVSDENVQTVMNIVTNLKSGLIESIEGIDHKSERKASYVPKTGKIVQEGERVSGKYISLDTYKNRIRKEK